jgi:hypothetical protein
MSMASALAIAAAGITTAGAWAHEPPDQSGKKGNNGWGNGGDDGTNPGSDQGGGVSQGGPGAGDSQADTKSSDEDR